MMVFRGVGGGSDGGRKFLGTFSEMKKEVARHSVVARFLKDSSYSVHSYGSRAFQGRGRGGGGYYVFS